jgi:hypothetical protein
MVKLCTAFVRELCVGTFGTAPEIVLDGMTDVTFTFVSLHVTNTFLTDSDVDTSRFT